MDNSDQERRWLWATLLLSSISIVALAFAFWELVENRYFRDLDYVSLHYLYISRGVCLSVFLAFWAAWFVLRQRRASEQELRRSHERYRGLLEISPGAVALFDEHLIVHEWNAAAERLYGYRRSHVRGHILPNVPAEYEAELRNFMQRAAHGESILNVETTRCDRFGELIAVQVSLLPYREPGTIWFLEVANDIRESVRLRQRLIEFEKLTSMGQMAAGTAHHLNTPLGSMLLRVQMMREREPADSPAAGDLARLEHSIGFCQQFVRRLLDFSRRPAAQMQSENVAAIIDAVLGFMSPTFVARRVTLETHVDAGSAHVLADRNELETLLLILLTNAVDAVDSGGHIVVKAHETGAGVEIAICDNGCGISPQDRARIFEPFFTTKPPGVGTGLGLAIARSIVAQHGGEIKLESEPGQGTCATVRLPLAALSAQASAPASAAVAESGMANQGCE